MSRSLRPPLLAPRLLLGLLLGLLLCASPLTACELEEVVPDTSLRVRVDTSAAVRDVDARFLSFTVDMDRVAAAGFDLNQPRLMELARQLGPSYLRVGGTKADLTYYDLGDSPVETPPEPYLYVLSRAEFDGMCDFASALSFPLSFGLNGGGGPRDPETGRWDPAQARELIRYARSRGCPVEIWELGNEVGAFELIHGFQMDGEGYAADYAIAREMLDEEDPESALAGPASAYWPILGEVLVPIIPDFLAAAGDTVDILSWHYYPQQSSSCPAASRPIGEDPLLDPRELDEVLRWAEEVEELRGMYAPSAEVWLNESSHAQCSGEPGISDRFVTSFWWLDQLGLMALRDQRMVARQALVGGSYSLVREEDTELVFEPNPDWYASVLWKRLMGPRSLAVLDEEGALPSTLRVYAHCAAEAAGPAGAVTLLALNLDRESALTLRLGDLLEGDLGEARELYRVTAEGLLSQEISLNGAPLAVDAAGTLAPLLGEPSGDPIELPPLSYAFVVAPAADLEICR